MEVSLAPLFLESPQVLNGLLLAELGPIEGAFYERYFNSRLATWICF